MYDLSRVDSAGAGLHPTLQIHILPVTLRSDDRRVIIRPFIVSDSRALRILDHVSKMDHQEIDQSRDWLDRTYSHRHQSLVTVCLEHYEAAALAVGWTTHLSVDQRIVAGSFFSMEYAIDSAALFNPSITPHPCQLNLAAGELRFVMSLRATGEGHLSSIVFRTGIIHADDSVTISTLPTRLSRLRKSPDRSYQSSIFRRKLTEMDSMNPQVDAILKALPDQFNLEQLVGMIESKIAGGEAPAGLRAARWLAESNFRIDVPANVNLEDLVIFPMSADDSNGIEDLRLTRFVEDDGTTLYCGTYTAYNGKRTLPMLLTTDSFKHMEFHSLNGRCALNKGMALFPRRVDGDLLMCGRIDGERLFLMRSRALHFWDNATVLAEPTLPWEVMLIGNCGPPVETERGWILLTHGVGPMRTYSLGALVLDRNDPSKIIGRLREPLITPSESGREGYVPNIVYTCGCIIHGDDLFIPFALADKITNMAVVKVDALIDQAISDFRN